MASTFSYRPKQYSVDQLKKIAQRHNTNLNRFIEEALAEKIQQEEVAAEKGPVEELSRKIARVFVEYKGFRLYKPDPETHAKIVKKVRETDRKNAWIPDEVARPEAYPPKKRKK